MNRSKDDGNYKQKTMKRVKYLNNFKHFDKVSDSRNDRLTSHVCHNYKIDLNTSKKLIRPRNSEYLYKL